MKYYQYNKDYRIIIKTVHDWASDDFSGQSIYQIHKLLTDKSTLFSLIRSWTDLFGEIIDIFLKYSNNIFIRI